MGIRLNCGRAAPMEPQCTVEERPGSRGSVSAEHSPTAAEDQSASAYAFPTAVRVVEHVVSVAAPALAGHFEAALPTPQILRTLADEVRKAMTSPRAVAHPELADPDAYWQLSAFPQAASLVRQLRGVLVEVAGELAPVVERSQPDFGTWLLSVAAYEAPRRRVDPDASRDAVIDEIAGMCGVLHEIVAGIRRIVPVETSIEARRGALAEARRKQVEDIAKRTGERAEAIDARLRHEPPHRHQDLLLDAFALAHESLRDDVEAMIVQLTEPIFALGERMVLGYGDAVAAVDAATSRPSGLLAG